MSDRVRALSGVRRWVGQQMAAEDIVKRLRDEADLMGMFVDTENLVTTLTQAADLLERQAKALDQVENICKGTEEALDGAPLRGISFGRRAEQALRIHVKNTRLVIAHELDGGSA